MTVGVTRVDLRGALLCCLAVAAFVIVFREGFEASLIVGLIFAYFAKTGKRGSKPVWLGAAGGVAVGACVGAILYLSVHELTGRAQILYTATAMTVAAGVSSWLIFWLRRHAATVGDGLRSEVAEGLRGGGNATLAVVACVAVAREAIAAALFMFASIQIAGTIQSVIGASAGLAAAIALEVLLYRGTLRIDLRGFFAVTSLLVIAISAYVLVLAADRFAQAGAGDLLRAAAPFVAAMVALALALVYLRGFQDRPMRRVPAGARRQDHRAPAQVKARVGEGE